jgi:hypothetical protein
MTLVACGPLDTSRHLSLLKSDDPTIRAWAVRAAGNQGAVDYEIVRKIRELAADESPEVKLQVAIAARKLKGVDPMPELVKVLANAGDDKLIPHIVWQNLHPLLATRSDDFLAEVKKYDLKATPTLAKIMPRAIERIAASKK